MTEQAGSVNVTRPLDYFELLSCRSVPASDTRRLTVLAIILTVFNVGACCLVLAFGPSDLQPRLLCTFLAALWCELVACLGIVFVRSFYSNRGAELYSQSTATATDFSTWYSARLATMFGHISRCNGRLDVDWRKEAPLVTYQGLFVIVWMGFALAFPGSNCPPWLTAIRLTSSLVFWTLSSYALRLMITSTILIRKVRDLGLVAPIGSVRSSGLTFLAGGWERMITMFFLYWPFFWLYTGAYYRHNALLDSIYALSAIALVSVWSIATAWSAADLSAALRRGSLSNLETFAIERRDAFLDNPTAANLHSLAQLTERLQDYERISYSPFKHRFIRLTVILNGWIWAVPILWAAGIHYFGLEWL